jgi:hypothetical protein
MRGLFLAFACKAWELLTDATRLPEYNFRPTAAYTARTQPATPSSRLTRSVLFIVTRNSGLMSTGLSSSSPSSSQFHLTSWVPHPVLASAHSRLSQVPCMQAFRHIHPRPLSALCAGWAEQLAGLGGRVNTYRAGGCLTI